MLLVTLALAATPPPPPIINGEEADASIYPMTGGIIIDTTLDMGSYGEMAYKGLLCSSTLIAPDTVLLAAHCIDPEVLTYGYGEAIGTELGWSRESDLSDWDGTSNGRGWPEDVVMGADWVFHEDFSIWDLEMGIAENFDIGLVFLDTPVTDVEHAYLITEEEAEQIAEGNLVDVVGWGQQEATSGYESPPAGSYAYKYWGESTIGVIGEPEFQVGPEKADVRKCHGDSGGPTFMEVESTSTVSFRQIGVTSHAYDSSDCDREGGVDTRVDHYLSWIDEEMTKRCEDGTRVWCDVAGIVPPPEPVVDPPDDGKDGADDEELEVGGCACSSSSAAVPGWLLLPGLALLFRRRR